ncbi:MAG: tRNA 2-thiocytidine(32) synthetase TtcA [Lentisphaeria bacterium]|nr:tRNA 2-thiocytidine(32) synthetase TtcA [Lentisphaeria bacterium]
MKETELPPQFKKIRRLAGEAVVRYGMIGEGDRVLVGLSGGKDSFILLEVLHKLRAAAPISFDVVAVTFDPGFPEFNAAGIRAFCVARNWEHHVIEMDIAGIVAEKDFSRAPCVLCSRLRRGRLYRLARELDCGKLALGHHLDDIIVSFLMNLCRGRGISTMAPAVPPKSPGKPWVIRPLALVPESLIAACAREMDLPPAGVCRYKEQLDCGDRKYFAQTVDSWEKRIPNLRSNIVRALMRPEPEHLLRPLEKVDFDAKRDMLTERNKNS